MQRQYTGMHAKERRYYWIMNWEEFITHTHTHMHTCMCERERKGKDIPMLRNKVLWMLSLEHAGWKRERRGWRQLCWLGHVHHMPNGCIPEVLFYGELAIGKMAWGLPHLHFNDVCKSDMRLMGIEINWWEYIIKDRPCWSTWFTLRTQVRRRESREIDGK